MKNLGLILLICSLFTSCSNKSEEEFGIDSPKSATEDIQKPPSNPPSSDGPSIPRDPGNGNDSPSQVVSYKKIQMSDLTEEELESIEFPYHRKTGAKLKLAGMSEESKKCSDVHKNKCIDRKQVHFHFNLENLKLQYEPELWKVESISLEASYISHQENDKTELICFLNTKKCSGKIIYQANSRFTSKIAKLLWINKKFWEKDHTLNIVNQAFTEKLESSFIDQDKVYMAHNTVFNIESLFSIDKQSLDTVVRKSNHLSFVVSDDTFVEDPVLTIKFVKIIK